jgi:hypothetical protein
MGSGVAFRVTKTRSNWRTLRLTVPKVFMNECLVCTSGVKRADCIYCSNKCQAEHVYQTYIERWLAGLESGLRGKNATSKHIRRWLVETRGERCEKCGWCKRHPVTGRVPVEMEHVDGNWQNNRPENLRLLCPNCHSLTPTYRSLNNGSGRYRYPGSSTQSSPLQKESVGVKVPSGIPVCEAP